MDNPETLATWGTQDTGRRQTKHKNTTQKNKKMSHTDNTKDRGWTQVHAQGLTYLTKITYSPLQTKTPIYIWLAVIFVIWGLLDGWSSEMVLLLTIMLCLSTQICSAWWAKIITNYMLEMKPPRNEHRSAMTIMYSSRN